VVLAIALPAQSVHATVKTGSADHVWGQPNFTSAHCLTGNAGPLSLCHPVRTVIDAERNLWVADWFDNRVLMYPFDRTAGLPSRTPSEVFGQYGSFATRGCNQSPPAATYPPSPSRYTLCRPNGLAVDRHGTLYVADQLNNRILVYFHAAHQNQAAAANAVLGQRTFSAIEPNGGRAGVGAAAVCGPAHPANRCSLFSPEGLSLDMQDDLLVADTANDRVLLWSAATLFQLHVPPCGVSCSVAASRSWGQYGSFSGNCPNQTPHSATCAPGGVPGPTAFTLYEPEGVYADAQGDLFVADTFNNRVLEYHQAIRSGRQAATTVYGQHGSFTSGVANLGGVSATSLSLPTETTLDPSNKLWISDEGNNRVLEFPPPDATAAAGVLGQRGSFLTNSVNQGGLDAGSLDHPTGISFDRSGNGFVADHGDNDRILEYLQTPKQPLG
jgi:sugar lactone lactonase YvrE